MEEFYKVFRLAIDMTDDALASHHPHELATILERVAAQIRMGADKGRAFDTNGNSVGRWNIGRTPQTAQQRIEEREKAHEFAEFLNELVIEKE